MARTYWLMKTEPSVFSIDDFKKCPKQTTHWEGVRNYQARNFMREMAIGDEVLIYHSNAEETGIAGVAKVVTAAYPDDSAWDKKSDYYDPKSSAQNPRWDRVDVQLLDRFSKIITLADLRQHRQLKDLLILRKGNRLSVTPVTAEEYDFIRQLGRS